MNLATLPYRRLIDVVAQMEGLPCFTWNGVDYQPGEWLEAQVLVESGGNPRARRFEAGLAKGPDRGSGESWASWGLLQVLGQTFNGLFGANAVNFGPLQGPLVGLAVGVKVLVDILSQVRRQNPWVGDSEAVSRALARFNGGSSGDVVKDGRMLRQDYVDRVGSMAALVRADRRG